MRKAKQIDTRTTPAKSSRKEWIITAVALVAIAAGATWMLTPQTQATSASTTPADSQGLLAKAPPAANARPLNADGAPMSD